MSKQEHLYQKLPLFLQNIAIWIQGYWIVHKRYNKQFYTYLNEFLANEEKTHSTKADIQSLALRKALQNASKSIFWSKRFRDYGVDISSNDIYHEILKLPVLTKTDVKNNHDKIVITDIKEKILYQYTSGTTGSGMKCPLTMSMLNKQWAVWWRYRILNGIDINFWCGWFGGKVIVPPNVSKPPYWRINKPGKQLMFSPLHLSKKTVGLYVHELTKRKIPWLHGYPSQLALLANYVKEMGLDVWPELKIVTIGAENLLDSQKALMEEVFKVNVKQHYGLTEGVANISEYPDGSLFVDDDFCYVEFLPLSDDKSICKIIGTNFSNYAFPLFRYDTGDIARVAYGENGEVKIFSIEGRGEDYLTLPDGSRFGPFNLIMKEFSNVIEAQLVQCAKDEIILRIVKGKDFTSRDEKKILNEVNKRLTMKVHFNIEYLTKLPRTHSGKLKGVVLLDQE